MVEKDTNKFSRESFKEKILRQLEENSDEQMANSERKSLNETPFERSHSSSSSYESGISSKNLNQEQLINQSGQRKKFSRRSEEDYQGIEKFYVPKERGESEAPLSIKGQTNPFSHSESSDFESDESSPDEDVEASFVPQHSRRRKEYTSEDPIETEEMAKQAEEQAARRAQKKKSTAGKIILVTALVLLFTIVGAGWYTFDFVKSSIQPYDSSNHTVKAVNIPEGSSSKQIGNILQRQGLIKNGIVFQYYTKLKNYNDFKSGYYNLSPDMSLSDIASQLEKGGTQAPVEPVLGKITIPEGQTLTQISKTITSNANEKNGKTPFKTEDFLKLVQDPTFIEKMKKAYPKLFESLPDKASGVKYQLEGYLFPATYEYTKKSTLESIVTSMIDAMNAQLTPYYDQIKGDAEQAGITTVNQVLSLAALVEKEANNDDDRRNVARVFYNRMIAGMTLDSNVSVLYASGKLGTKTTLKEDATIDTKMNSPFNLYLAQGTGPGPVDSSSLSSIKAVLNPASNDYYYFVADVTNGKVYFAKTLEEQNANVQTYVNAKLAG